LFESASPAPTAAAEAAGFQVLSSRNASCRGSVRYLLAVRGVLGQQVYDEFAADTRDQPGGLAGDIRYLR